MIGNLLAGLVLTMSAPEGVIDAPYIPSERILPEIHAQIERASDCYESGEWGQTIARSDLVLFVQAIRYRVTFDEGRGANQEKQREALSQAMRLWEDSLDGQVRFEETDEATVELRFQESVTNRGREVGGHIKWRRDVAISSSGEFSPNIKADIWIRTRQPNGRAMTIEAMRHVAGHELGHVLGMNDSGTIGDVMGPIDLRRPSKGPRAEEIEALKYARERASDLRRASLISALRELEGYNSTRASR